MLLVFVLCHCDSNFFSLAATPKHSSLGLDNYLKYMQIQDTTNTEVEYVLLIKSDLLKSDLLPKKYLH